MDDFTLTPAAVGACFLPGAEKKEKGGKEGEEAC